MLMAVVVLFALSNLPVHVYNNALAFGLFAPPSDEEEDLDMNMIALVISSIYKFGFLRNSLSILK